MSPGLVDRGLLTTRMWNYVSKMEHWWGGWCGWARHWQWATRSWVSFSRGLGDRLLTIIHGGEVLLSVEWAKSGSRLNESPVASAIDYSLTGRGHDRSSETLWSWPHNSEYTAWLSSSPSRQSSRPYTPRFWWTSATSLGVAKVGARQDVVVTAAYACRVRE